MISAMSVESRPAFASRSSALQLMIWAELVAFASANYELAPAAVNNLTGDRNFKEAVLEAIDNENFQQKRRAPS